MLNNIFFIYLFIYLFQEHLKMNNSEESDSIKPILYGMINQIGEAEDNIIVEDLRGMSNHMNSYVKLLHVSLSRVIVSFKCKLYQNLLTL